MVRIGNDGTFFDRLDGGDGLLCRECGEPVEDDPDGSPGVAVHDRQLGDRAYDLDEDHTPAVDDSDSGDAILNELAAPVGAPKLAGRSWLVCSVGHGDALLHTGTVDEQAARDLYDRTVTSTEAGARVQLLAVDGVTGAVTVAVDSGL